MLIEYDGKKPKVSAKAFVAPNATLIGDVAVADYASIWFGAQLRGDLGKIVVGARSNVQDNAVIHVDHDQKAIIEEDVTVGHSAVLHNCTIKKRAVIGIHAVVLDNAVVGEQAVVAAGSVVVEGTKIPPRCLVAGMPAQVKKELSGSSLRLAEGAARAYTEMAQNYLRQGVGQMGTEAE